MTQYILTNEAPAPIGPYSQGVLDDDLLFCSGQTPIDPANGNLVEGGISAQAGRVLENIGAVLRAAGCDFSNVVKTTIFLTDMNDFAAVNAVYARYFGESKPARSTIAVAALPRNCSVEIEAIARKR